MDNRKVIGIYDESNQLSGELVSILEKEKFELRELRPADFLEKDINETQHELFIFKFLKSSSQKKQFFSKEKKIKTPFLFLEDQYSLEDFKKALDMGADDYLVKNEYLNIILPLKIKKIFHEMENLKILEETEKALEQALEDLEFKVLHDPLTNLPNRAYFIENLNRCISSSRRTNNYNFAILFLDLDRFKSINDSLGHGAGDVFLKEVSTRILSSLRTNDLAARMGGDEFTVLLDSVKVEADVIRVANRIQESLSKPYILDGQEVVSSASIGIVTFPKKYSSADELLRDADAAMYKAKKAGKARFVLFDSTMSEKVISDLELENDLRVAVHKNELVLYYQPIYSCEKKLVGMEALLRWNHHSRGMIPPDEFIPFAEETGLIDMIGNWVLEKGLEDFNNWSLQNPNLEFIAINVSNVQLKNIKFSEKVMEKIKKYNIDPGKVVLEITESSFMENEEVTMKLLQELKENKIKIAIDDFGTGFSSLSYLKKIPMNILKIDKAFVHGLPDDKEDHTITQAIIAIAKALNLEITAEGIENERQFNYCVENGCNKIQGFYFSKPLTKVEFEGLL